MFKKAVFLAFVVAAFARPAIAAEPGLSFSADDRVLVIAPHPDDETLGVGGLLQRARAAGAGIRVVYLTNGESNEVASIFHQKRPLLWRSDFLKSGVQRKKEALEATAQLGLTPDQLVFFGYPDGGLLSMWVRHWGSAKPYRSFFTQFSRVPYKDNFSAGRAFKGDELLRDLERVILEFQPSVVFMTAPFDTNADHQAAYLYAQVALMNLREGSMPPPRAYLYLIHAPEWPEPQRPAPDRPLAPPPHIEWPPAVRWNDFSLTTDELKKKSEALLKYKSQLSYKRNFLLAFARKNELYAEYPVEKVEDVTEPDADASAFGNAASAGDVRYKVLGEEMWIEIPLSAMMDEMGAVTAYVFGYRRGFLFSDMPKLRFRLFGNKMFVHNGDRSFYDPKVVYRFEEDRLFLRIPLRVLKNPHVIFVSNRNAKEPASLDFGSWRMLEVPR